MEYGTIGSISHATLRTGDLLEAFAFELERLNGKRAVGAPHSALHILISDALEWDEDKADPDDTGPDMVAELIDALGEHAPPYCYFGAHEGDGSDFGFWPSWDAIDEAVGDGDIAKVADLAELDGRAESEALVVSDHGNATLYVRDGWREVWGIV